MKKLLLTLLYLSSFAQATIIPSEESIKLVPDELFPYQWGLLNQGQTLIKEKDDLHNLPLKGVVGKDIGWKNSIGKSGFYRPIVAILDSGVDLAHPELQGNLWKNEKECGKDPTQDNDGNKLAGDCHGWNFTEDMNSPGAKDPSDIDGHGTHIAGIIAALNNGQGIVGVSPNALIMPIKVMKDPHSNSQIPSAEAFARGIIYAVENGADIINMSLGWPRSLETKLLRDAVYLALSRGVVIVAAAGNNNSTEPLFPCAYDGVICVGASTVDGNFAGFSNYGGHVDTIAPGEGILGLHPILFEPDYFPVPGFELRSGTSQAAPFVTGLVAIMKSLNNKISIDELFAKLYLGQVTQDDKKYVLGGIASWESIYREVNVPVIRPTFKKVRQLLFKGEAEVSQLVIPVRNFGHSSGVISVQVESLSPAIEISSGPVTIENLNQGEFKDLPFNVKLINPELESNLSIKVTIQSGEKKESFLNEIPVVRDIRSEERFKRLEFSFKDKKLPVGTVRDGEINSLISTIESATQTGRHEFFLRRFLNSEEGKTLELTLFSRQGNKVVEGPQLIFIKNAISLVNFIRVDLNLDGEEDYLVHTLAEKDGKKYFVFSFYDSSLKALWPSFQDTKLNLDLYLESMNDLTFMKFHDPKLGAMMVPAFYTSGQLPVIDQVVSSWDRLDTSAKKRLYYLEPSGEELKVRALTTNSWEEKVKNELKSKWFETVETEALLPLSVSDLKNGKVRVLVSVGMGSRRQLFIHSFDAQTETHGSKLPQLVLQTDSIDPLLNITASGLMHDGDVYFNIYDRTRAKIVTTKDESQLGEYVIRHDTESDLIAGHITSFKNGENGLSIFQSREELISITTGEEEKRTSRPKLRYSFLSQRLLSEMYFPVIYNRNEQMSPALYVDATSVTGNRIYLFEEQQGELVSSVKNSLIVPPGCKTLNPYFSQESSSHEFVFLCLEGRDWAMRTYRME